MFIIFLKFVTSKWLNFTDYNYYVYFQEESRISPIITLFTNSSDSDDLISQFKNFSITFEYDQDLNFMHVDCLNSSICLNFDSFSYPSLYFVQGSNFHYWTRINSNDWTQEINRFFGILRSKSIEDDMLSKYIESTTNGGTFFHLKIRPEFKTVLKKFNESSKYYTIFNSTFAYTFENIQAASITSYYSENCFIHRRIRPVDIDGFCEENKFSFYHIYKKFEVKEFITKNPFIFIVFNHFDELPSLHKSVFEKFNSFCHTFKFGFIQHEEQFNLLQQFDLENITTPFLFGINVFKNCYLYFPIDSNNTFYNDLLNGEHCLHINSKYNHIPFKQKSHFSMFSYVLTFALVFAIFYCIAKDKRCNNYNYNSNFNNYHTKSE